MVIAHRGTDIKNFDAFVTDVKGVLFNNYVEQMSSAFTFTNKVVTVLQQIEQEKKVSFEIFFTGHSLGGWLAQITMFTTEYREEIKGRFLKKPKREQDEPLASSNMQDSHDVRQNYHPHTVVFDSPGCKDMLSQMAAKFDVGLQGGCIDLQQLDITSYLSAPNLINTYISHVGTVCRIYTDLSDMVWKGKHTPLYNLATHSMGRIKQAFDPETGQVYKDNKGELKIREVVDWPVGSGLTAGAELNDFCKWANHLNNYHPEEMDISYSKFSKGQHSLRYQTKAYDDCTKNLSAFTQDEREFLELYRWLRHVPEFFKPEHLFCLLSNVEAEKEAERKLQNFELSNERIRCPDASTLHGLIPFVKRLVRHFPHVKEKVKDQLTSAQIGKGIYHYETQRYVQKIEQNSLDFNSSALRLREFLGSDKQIWHLRMVDGDAWTGITKVYRVLQNTSCTPNYSSEGRYSIMDLEKVLMVNRLANLDELLTSMEKPHLLMIACGTNQPVNDEVENILQELFNILKGKYNIKIILTTQTGSEIADFIQETAKEIIGEGFITTDEQLSWSDLTASSQTTLLEKTVIFQGRRIALNQLTSVEPMTDSIPLADLLKGKELRIGEEPLLSAGSGYNEENYIDRTFNHNIVIRQDFRTDKQAGIFTDLLASSETEFIQLCQLHPKKNVHWLEQEKSGELIWQKSQGNLQTLRKYIDNQKSHCYAPSDLDNLLHHAKQQRVTIIADKAGMGKTIVLTQLFKQIKQKYPAHWLVGIGLNDYTKLLKALEGKKMDKELVLEFVSKEVLKLESHSEKELFKKAVEGNEVSKVVVMVDGFDKISPKYKYIALDMLHVLKQTSLEHLWVTTRPHLKEDLEDKLQQLSYTLQPFSQVEQIEFLKKYWTENLNLEITYQHRLETYAAVLIRKLTQSVSDKDKKFTGIPLQTHMLAEAFEENFRSFYLSEKSEPDLPHKLNLLGLYRGFVESKFDIYYREKSKIPACNVAAEEQLKREFKYIQKEHQQLAFKALFTDDKVPFLEDYHFIFSDEDLARIGIVQRNYEGKPHFVDNNFAHYFVAQFLINQLTEITNPNPHVQDILLNKVLSRKDYQVTRHFLDGLLEISTPSKETLKQFGEQINKQWKERETRRTLIGVTTALRQAAAEDNACIVGFLMNSLKSAEHLTILKEIMLDVDDQGCPVWYMAAQNGSLKALQEIWECFEEVIFKRQIKQPGRWPQ